MSENDEVEDLEDEFPITGKFNVPSIFPVNIITEDFNIEELNDLPEFEEGTQTSPGEGYFIHRDITVTDFIQENPNLNEVFDNAIMIDFVVENYGKISRYIDGRIIGEIKKKGVNINHIFWLLPDLIIVKGSRDTAQIFSKSFINIFKRRVTLGNPYIFNPWFFVWIISKYRNEDYELDENFFVDFILDMSVEGQEQDLMGQYAQIKKSLDVTRSILILLPLLKKKLPIEFLFSITIDNFPGTIKINRNGNLLIYLSKGKFKDISSLDKVILACFFIKRIIRLYNNWQNLPKLEKIPPPNFIQNICRECDERGIEITADVVATIQMYENERK